MILIFIVYLKRLWKVANSLASIAFTKNTSILLSPYLNDSKKPNTCLFNVFFLSQKLLMILHNISHDLQAASSKLLLLLFNLFSHLFPTV